MLLSTTTYLIFVLFSSLLDHLKRNWKDGFGEKTLDEIWESFTEKIHTTSTLIQFKIFHNFMETLFQQKPSTEGCDEGPVNLKYSFILVFGPSLIPCWSQICLNFCMHMCNKVTDSECCTLEFLLSPGWCCGPLDVSFYTIPNCWVEWKYTY